MKPMIIGTWNKEVLEHNLAFMDEQMIEVLLLESMGGNAGSDFTTGGTNRSCVATRFYAGIKTGKIYHFGIDDYTPKRAEQATHGVFRALCYNRPPYGYKIIGIYPSGQEFSDEAIHMLVNTMVAWNDRREERLIQMIREAESGKVTGGRLNRLKRRLRLVFKEAKDG